jgi:AcrR family transcriptional regulator
MMEKTRRRRQILDAAASVFAARGYHETAVSDIIEEAGIARGTFYLYFESKRGVFGELIDKFLVELRSCIRRIEIGPDHPPPYEQLHGIVSRFLATVLEERDVAVIVLNHAVGLDEESDRMLNEFWGQLSGAVERALATGKRFGLVSVDNFELGARFILGGAKEILHHLVVRGGNGKDHDEIVEEFIRIGLRGVIEGKLQSLLSPIPTTGEC